MTDMAEIIAEHMRAGRITDSGAEARAAFYASDAWDHEYCDPSECDGRPHTDPPADAPQPAE